MKNSAFMKIGERIKVVFDNLPKEQDVSWLAKELHCDRRNIYRIFNKENMDVQLLLRLSYILDHDFFRDLSAFLQENKESLKDL